VNTGPALTSAVYDARGWGVTSAHLLTGVHCALCTVHYALCTVYRECFDALCCRGWLVHISALVTHQLRSYSRLVTQAPCATHFIPCIQLLYLCALFACIYDHCTSVFASTLLLYLLSTNLLYSVPGTAVFLWLYFASVLTIVPVPWWLNPAYIMSEHCRPTASC